MLQIEHVNDLLDQIIKRPRIPRATYRLQFNGDFTFQDAQNLLDYLQDLGISDVYGSPIFKPRSSSTHGYDTVDYNEFNAKIGTEDDFNALTDALRERGMGFILDIVPNHMGVNTENEWWTDVLKQGPSSKYGHYFDIDWLPRNRSLDNKVLLPVLGDHYGRVLEAGELELVYWHGDFYLHYYEHQFPITPETYGVILSQVLEHLLEAGNAEEWVEVELSSVINSLNHLPSYTTNDPEELVIRRREQTIVRWRLLGLFDKSEAFRNAMQAALETLNGDPDDLSSFDTVDALLQNQPYRLSYWRVATDEINYRRFFDINDMAAVRVEEPQVFDSMHKLTLKLLSEERISGVRIDHPDGLWDPEAYFLRLQEAYTLARVEHELSEPLESDYAIAQRLSTLAPTGDEPAEWPLYVLVEKILSETEPLPAEWAVYGTTGYDFMYMVNNLFVNSVNEPAFDALYAEFIEEDIDFHELIDMTKKLVMSQSLTSEIEARSAELARIVERNRRYRGFTRNSLAFAMSEFIAALPIYRTYITGPGDVTERDRHYIEQAIKVAKKHNALTASSIFDFLRDVLLMDNWQDFSEAQRADLREFVMKFQQITGPVMAKSVEDTAFYIYNRLTSLNEVGGHPDRFGASAADFHAHVEGKSFPYSMLSTSTHDTKRSEDIRARISVLSEIPEDWRETITTWKRLNADAKTEVNGEPAPSANDEYLLYQSLIGAWPDGDEDVDGFKSRVIAYMHKAINEAKTHSNWINPNDAYAQAITDFITTIMDDKAFIESFKPMQERTAFYGKVNALAQVLLKLTTPGIPDVYQGNELWNYSLVDPDNRRLIDFEERRVVLDALKADIVDDRDTLLTALTDNLDDGRIKFYLTYTTLNFRREHEDLFRDGVYYPVDVQGSHSDHICAFVRVHEETTVLVVVPRLTATLMGDGLNLPLGDSVWQDTRLVLPREAAISEVENILTGETLTTLEHGERRALPVGDVLARFPVGVFHGKA